MTFDLSGVTATGTSEDGVPWVVGSNIQLEALSPGPVDVGSGDWRNGWAINPRHAKTAPQPFDARIENFMVSGQSLPAALSADHIVVACESEPAPADVRDGVIRSWAGLLVRSTPPPSGMMAPALIGWNNRTGFDGPVVDLDGLMAARPRLSSASVQVPAVADVLGHIGRLAIGPALNWAANGVGYEAALPHRFGMDASYSNYGNETARTIGAAALLTCLDTTPDADARTLLRWLIQHGVQWHDTLDTHPEGACPADGAHNQFQLFPMVLALHAAGRDAEIDTLETRLPGNLLGQAFHVSEAFRQASVTPHDGTAGLPQNARRRALVSVTASSVSIPTFSGRDVGKIQPIGADLVRESDGHRVGVNTVIGSNVANGSPIELGLGTGHGLSPGDVVTIQPATALTAGDAEWAVRYRAATTSAIDWESWMPGSGQSYRPLANWAEQVLALKAWGFTGSGFDAAVDYTVGMVRADWPAGDDYDDPFVPYTEQGGATRNLAQSFWTAHAAGLGLS
ncbi:hypothetical protein AB0T83_11020 [Fluviibacterium sp. DFM31]|uniref:Uncharacterized protein n=1 Tax=Meridianimarinicoccus marinus TaxID=3231483 RepID=A0ABV3L6X0_9RHOB